MRSGGWLKELGTHAWVAKRLRMNWEESHTLGLVPKEVLEAIIKDALERRREAAAGPPELSRQGSDLMTELAKRVAYCKGALS